MYGRRRDRETHGLVTGALGFAGRFERDVVREAAGDGDDEAAETGGPGMGGRARSDILGERRGLTDRWVVNWGSDWFGWVAVGSTLCNGEEGPELVRAWSVLLRMRGLLGETWRNLEARCRGRVDGATNEVEGTGTFRLGLSKGESGDSFEWLEAGGEGKPLGEETTGSSTGPDRTREWRLDWGRSETGRRERGED